MSEDLITRAETLLEGVTPGPWEWHSKYRRMDGESYAEVLYPGNVKCMSHCYGGSSTIDGDNLDKDAEFIAAARTLVPELLAEVKRLREQLDGLHEEWGLQYDSVPFDVVFGREANPDGTVTRVAPMPNEVYARQALASPAPIGAKNKVVVCRRVSDWEAFDPRDGGEQK